MLNIPNTQLTENDNKGSFELRVLIQFIVASSQENHFLEMRRKKRRNPFMLFELACVLKNEAAIML